MQEKTINKQMKVGTRRYTSKEERQIQVENWEKSGLTMSEFCRQNNVSLACLSEWKRSIFRDKIDFKAFKSLASIDTAPKPSNVIEIIVDQRIKIRLQHVTEASLVIHIAKGLMGCN